PQIRGWTALTRVPASAHVSRCDHGAGQAGTHSDSRALVITHASGAQCVVPCGEMMKSTIDDVMAIRHIAQVRDGRWLLRAMQPPQGADHLCTSHGSTPPACRPPDESSGLRCCFQRTPASSADDCMLTMLVQIKKCHVWLATRQFSQPHKKLIIIVR